MPKISKRIRIASGLLIFIVISAVIALPFLLNPDHVKQWALEQFQRTFGPHVSIGRIDFSLYPFPHLEVFEVVAQERLEAHAFFRAKHLSLTFGMSSLLRQQLSVNELVIDQPEIELRKNRDGQWSMYQGKGEDNASSLLSSFFLIDNVQMSGGHLTIIDESPLEEVRGLVFENVAGTLMLRDKPRASTMVTLSGDIRQSHEKSTLILNGLLDRLSASSEQVGVPAVSRSGHPFQFNGMVKVTSLDTEPMAEFLHVTSERAAIFGKTNLEGHVSIAPGQLGYDVVFSELAIRSDVGSFSGSANVSGIMAEDLTVNVTLQSSPIALQVVKNLIPSEGVGETFQPIWQEAEIDGTIEVVEATLTGSTRSNVGLSVVGRFQLHKSSIAYPPQPPQFEQIDGVIVVEPDRIRFENFTGLYDSVPVRTAEGILLFKDSGPWLEVEIEGPVTAKRVVRVFKKFNDSKKLSSPLTGMQVLSGSGDLRLKLAGFLTDDAGLSFQSGEYVGENLEVQLAGWQQPFTEGVGRFRFTPKEILCDDVNGRIGGNRFRAHGVIQVQPSTVFDQMTLQATLSDWSVLGSGERYPRFEGMNVQGPIFLNAKLSGPLNGPHIKGDMNFMKSGFQLAPLVSKRRGVPGSLEFEVRVGEKGKVLVDRVELALLPVRLSGRGVMRVSPTFEMVGRFSTGPVSLSVLPKGVTLGQQVLQSGTLEVSLIVKGRGMNWRNWQTKGWLAITKGEAKLADLNTSISNLFLRVKISPDHMELKRVEFQIQESDVQMTGRIKHWKDQPEVEVAIESSIFDFDLVVPKGTGSSVRESLERLAARSTVVGTITVEQPKYKHLEGRNLSALLKIHDGLVSIDRIRGEAYGQPLTGRVFIHLPPDKPAALRASFDVVDFPLEQIQQAAGYTKRFVTGTLSARGMVQGHGRDPLGTLATLQGKVDIRIQDGHFQQGKVVPRILSILNLPSILKRQVDLTKSGFPFHSVSGTVNIQKGMLQSEDVIVDSPIMKMTAAGQYDLPRDNLDLVAAVSPFGQYSAYLQRIPLFGNILSGDRKGLATALFQVQGSLTQPDVRYLPTQSLKTGVTGFANLAVDVLRNTIRLPIDLLKSEHKRSQDVPSQGQVDDSVSPSPRSQNIQEQSF